MVDKEDEDNNAAITLFNTDEEISSPDYKHLKGKHGALKSTQWYTQSQPSSRKEDVTLKLREHTTLVDFGVTLSTNDKPSEFAIKVKDLLNNFQLLDATASFVELSTQDQHQIKGYPDQLHSAWKIHGIFRRRNLQSTKEMEEQWKQAKHRDNEEETPYSKAVYGTARVTSNMESDVLDGTYSYPEDFDEATKALREECARI